MSHDEAGPADLWQRDMQMRCNTKSLPGPTVWTDMTSLASILMLPAILEDKGELLSSPPNFSFVNKLPFGAKGGQNAAQLPTQVKRQLQKCIWEFTWVETNICRIHFLQLSQVRQNV